MLEIVIRRVNVKIVVTNDGQITVTIEPPIGGPWQPSTCHGPTK